MTPQQLIDLATCYQQCIPDGMKQAVIISLLDQISTGGGGGSQTPWLSNINGGGFALSNVSSVAATSFVGALTGAASLNVLKAGDTWTGLMTAASNGLAFSGSVLLADAANTLAQRNGTNAQAFRVYNTFTDASNYTRAKMGWNGAEFDVWTENAGTGAATDLFLKAASILYFAGGGNNAQWKVSTAGHFLAHTDNAYDIGASGATRPRSIYVAVNGIFGTTVSAASVEGRSFVGVGGVTLTPNSVLQAPSSGVLGLYNGISSDFSRLQFGGTTSSFPALKRSSAVLQARLADDSAFAQLQGKLTTDANATTGLVAGALAALTNASITITDASGQVYRVPCII